jgi:hypothetical protein
VPARPRRVAFFEAAFSIARPQGDQVNRISRGTTLAVLALALVTAVLWAPSAGASTAQQGPNPNACFPNSDPDYPPTGPSVQIVASLRLVGGHFVPGGTGTVDLAGAAANATLCGTAFSTPITLPAKAADANGNIHYEIAVPADFELGAPHHIDVFQQQVKVGNFDFCVDKKGDIAPNSACAAAPKAKGPLARTGSNHALDIVRIAGIVICLGAGALYLRRRLRTSAG